MRPIRVMTWNIWGRHGAWESRHNLIVEVLSHSDADIIGLQEVWADELTATNHGQLLARSLNFDLHFGLSRKSGSASIGNAILSRWPMANQGNMVLPVEAVQDDPRIAVYAHVNSPAGPIPVLTAHLTWQRNASHARQQQVTAIQELASSFASTEWPPILLGDFNADACSDEIRTLTGQRAGPANCIVFQDAWLQGGDGSHGHTWTPESSNFELSRGTRLTAMPWLRRRIDYIFVGLPDGQTGHMLPVQIERTWIDGRDASGGPEGSDHYAVVADCTPLQWYRDERTDVSAILEDRA